MTCSVWTVLLTGVCSAPASLTGGSRQGAGTRGPRTPGFPFPARPSAPPRGQSMGGVGGASFRHQGQQRPHSTDCTQESRMTQPQKRKEHSPYFEKETAHILRIISSYFLKHLENNETHKEVNCEGMLAYFKQTGSRLS